MFFRFFTCSILAVTIVFDAASACSVRKEEYFSGEAIRLLRDRSLPSSSNFAIFKAPLAVNTDGAPNSYHPYDFKGERKSINRIDNGVGIKRIDRKILTTGEKIQAFEKWRDSGWQNSSQYKITWKNVIAQGADGKPCVFKSGEYKGYFGSLTSLKNQLKGLEAGACDVKDQLDQRFIAAIVLRGNTNPLRSFGVKVGDLVFALNPQNGNVVRAIVGDTGDGDRIGEGSVALNKALLGRSALPTNYDEAKALDTGSRAMIVAVIPKSAAFERIRPYTAENINSRVDSWISVNGYGDVQRFKQFLLSCSSDM